jgi:hypothetical protein
MTINTIEPAPSDETSQNGICSCPSARPHPPRPHIDAHEIAVSFDDDADRSAGHEAFDHHVRTGRV